MSDEEKKESETGSEPASEKDEIDSLYSRDSFSTIRLEFKLTNIVTRKSVDSQAKPGEPLATLQEALDTGFKTEVPSSFCLKNQRILFDGVVTGLDKKYSMKEEAVVSKVESHQTISYQKSKEATVTESPVDTVTLVFQEEALVTMWKELRGLFEKRQAQIEDFFKAAKG